jgi:hypothetical protein
MEFPHGVEDHKANCMTNRRSLRILATVLWAALTGMAAAQPGAGAAAERKAFQFGAEDAAGALVNDYADRWIEFGRGGVEAFHFLEVARSDETIELLDRGRDIGLRVHAERGEIRLPRSTNWQEWQRGKWTSLDELPQAIRFVPTDQKIRLVYFVPADRPPIDGYQRRIRVVMQLVAEIFRDDLRGKGYRSDGPSFETDAQGEPVVHLVEAKRPAAYYNNAPAFDGVVQFERIKDEIPPTVGSVRRHMIVLFAETYDPGPAAIEWNGSAGRGLHLSTDGGLGVMSAWILRDEFCAMTLARQKELMFDATPIEGRTAMGSGRPNSPRFEFIEDGFGAVAHELGHALGLPHDHREPLDLMGNGFRSLQVNYLPKSKKQGRVTFSRENARLLGVSRYLSQRVDLTDNVDPTAEITMRLAKGGTVAVVSMKASDNIGLSAAVFFDPQHDTVIGGAELKGRNQNLNLKLPLKELKPGDFKLVTMLADGGGNIANITTTATSP